MKVEDIYTSVACNRTPDSADWGNNGLIVFASCHAVSLLDPNYKSSAKIINTFVKHTKRVNTVKWISRNYNQNEFEFISGSDDGTAIVWDIKNLSEPSCIILKGHESGINVVEAYYINNKLKVATASTDSSIKLWSESDNQFECFQTIHLSRGFCFSIRMCKLPNSEQILLAYAGDDDTICLWTETETSKKYFQKIHQFVGHEDWVRSLDFINVSNGDLLLASSSQDTFIRLWRISPRTKNQVEENKINFLDIPEGDIHIEEKTISLKSAEGQQIDLAISLESVLQGHEGWVYGIHWNNSQNLQLLSCSLDKTLIIWELNEENGVWMEKIRLGEVGGNSLGFFGGKFSKDGKSVMSHGFQGSFHIWKQCIQQDDLWMPSVITGGHFSEVRDICWEPKGEYLLSVSADQTTRIHAPWFHNDKTSETITWHELARPQVHGYDMQSVVAITRYKFASGAEEKIIRSFHATANFIENFRKICNIKEDAEGDELLKSLPKGASVPSLGLSNKAVYNCDENIENKHVKDEYPENYFVPISLNSPPEEESLMQNTLWPEVQKLYGHGFEIYALACTPDGSVLASSCKATTAEHAQIILWNTKTWKQFQKLASHQLTVTQMKFSPNNKYLLSVSRDRRWTLFENKSTNDIPNFEIIARPDKSNGIHSRIIWSCDWSHDSKLFITSSRDGKVVPWTKTDVISDSSLREWKALQYLEIPNESITAVAFLQDFYNSINDTYLTALGLETGKIILHKFDLKWHQLYCLENRSAHHLTVKKLQFRPCCKQIFLASCGEDNHVRIMEIQI